MIHRSTLWNRAHPEIVRARVRAYNRRNKEKIRASRAAWRKANPEKAAAIHRAAHLRAAFNVTVEQYEARLASQKGVCAICQRPERRKGRGGKVKPLSIDHCHGTGVLRGLLCADCNQGLGHFRDDPEALHRAINYLRGV